MIMPVKADVTNFDDCNSMVQTALDSYGKLNVVFANAGVGGNKTEFVDMSIEEWDRVVDVNLRGMMLTCKASVPAMIEADGGAIVSTSSTLPDDFFSDTSAPSSS